MSNEHSPADERSSAKRDEAEQEEEAEALPPRVPALIRFALIDGL